MPSATTPLRPTWVGFIPDTREALILFEATIQGLLNRVTRRPHDRERSALIQSGSVFIYEEGASGIKRWTDGVSWSPSRILNNFLIYRELEKPFPPGEKKRAKPKVKQTPSDESNVKQGGGEGSVVSPSTPSSATSPSGSKDGNLEKDSKRSLVGSLTESYNFKDPGGLVKKTMSVVVDGAHYHLVSYYNPDDVENNRLERPMNTDLKWVRVRSDLISRQNFRAPIDEADEAIQQSSSWAPPPARGSFMSPNPGHTSFLQQDYMQQQGPAVAMSPQSPSYQSQWGQQDPRSGYGDQRYSMSMPSPVQGQAPYMSQMAPMPQQVPMRSDFSPQYSHPSYAAEQQRYQQQLHEQQHQQPQPPQSQALSYGQHYPSQNSPMQSSSMQGWAPR